MSYGKIFGLFTLISIGVSFMFFLVFFDSAHQKTSPFAFLGDSVTAQFGGDGFSPEEEVFSENVSSLFVNELAKEIQKRNPSGPREIEGTSSFILPDNLAFDDILKNHASAASFSTLIPKITDEQIIIINVNTTSSYATYLKELFAVTSEVYSGPLLSGTPPEDRQKAYFWLNAEMALRYEKMAKKINSLAVPSELKEFHKRELALLEAQKKLFAQIALGEKDPLGSAIAIAFSKKIDEEFAKLREELRTALSLFGTYP